MIATPVAVGRINDSEVAYERAAEKAMKLIRDAGETMVVKCTPRGVVYVDSIHNGTDPRLTIVVIDPVPGNRPPYREHMLEDAIKMHAIEHGLDSGIRRGNYKGRSNAERQNR